MSSPRRMPFPGRRPASIPASPAASATPARRGPAALDVSTWSGAVVVMLLFTAVLWVVGIVNAVLDYRLDRFGLRPRHLDGLWGVLTEPFLHANFAHLVSNTLPVLFIGWVLLLAGLRVFAQVSAIVILVGGLLTWLVGPSDTVIVGASALVFGWLGYLFARAWFSREWKWIFVAAAVFFFFGTLLFGMFPTLHSDVSWQAHVCGFVAGIAAGAVLHPRRRSAVL